MPRITRRRTKLIRPERFPPEMLKRVARLYAEGLTMTDVGRRVGLYREAVNRLLQSQGKVDNLPASAEGGEPA